MTLVNDARSALQSGASTVLSTVRRRQKATRRLVPINTKKLMKQLNLKQLNRRFTARRTRRSPILPIVIALGATAAGVATGFFVWRYFLTRSTGEEPEAAEVYTHEEAVVAD